MNKPLISIIIPIYNVEKYLKRCVDSVLNQTYSNLEIILVDDGSKDSCSDICDLYSKKDSRIKVIHKINGGLSDARNKGIEIARGSYLGFVDSDDFIHPKMYEILYKNMVKTEADMSICSFKKVYNGEMDDFRTNNIFSCTRESGYYHLYDQYGLDTIVAWNKLYKKCLFDDIRYPIGKIHEDEFIIHHLIGLCNKIVYTDAELLYYFQREGSITGSYNIKRLDLFDALDDRLDYFFNKKENKLYALTLKSYILSLCCHLVMLEQLEKYDKGIKKKISNQLCEKYKTSIKNKFLSKTDHFKIWFAYTNKKIFYKLINIKK